MRGHLLELLTVFGADGCFPDNHDIISMKLFQLMVEHPLEDETVDWTKIEPSVSLLKSPKGESLGFGNLQWRTGTLKGLLKGIRAVIPCENPQEPRLGQSL